MLGLHAGPACYRLSHKLPNPLEVLASPALPTRKFLAHEHRCCRQSHTKHPCRTRHIFSRQSTMQSFPSRACHLIPLILSKTRTSRMPCCRRRRRACAPHASSAQPLHKHEHRGRSAAPGHLRNRMLSWRRQCCMANHAPDAAAASTPVSYTTGRPKLISRTAAGPLTRPQASHAP